MRRVIRHVHVDEVAEDVVLWKILENSKIKKLTDFQLWRLSNWHEKLWMLGIVGRRPDFDRRTTVLRSCDGVDYTDGHHAQ